MNRNKITKLRKIFQEFEKVKMVYLFGSKVSGKTGPLSDYDFAIYVDEKDKQKLFEIKYKLRDKISRLFGTDKIDVVIINTTQSPELKYNIISNGKNIYEIEPFRVIVEPKILNEYFDYYQLVKKYKLTKV